MKDLFILVADKNLEFAVKGAITRNDALGIRRVDCTIRVHAGRDGGARKTGPDILGLERESYGSGLLIFDFEGCGSDAVSALQIEDALDKKLQEKFGPRSKSIVIEPESDIWVWGSDNALSQLFGWNDPITIREWLKLKGFEFDIQNKPLRPKEAIEAILFETKQPRSSSLYKGITSCISLKHCSDPAFHRLCQRLCEWFPPA